MSSDQTVHGQQTASQECHKLIYDLRKQIASAKAEPAPIALEECRPRLDHLAALLREVSPTLPKREQQVFAEAYTELTTALKVTTSQPRQKFRFNKTSLSAGTQAASPVGPACPTIPLRNSTPAPSTTQQSNTAELPDRYSINDRNDEHIVAQACDRANAASVMIDDLEHCIVDLGRLAGSMSTLTIKNVARSIVFCSEVRGSVHLTNISDCIILLACRQIRIHKSRDTDVYSHCTSRTIIEDSKTLKFAPLPSQWVPSRNVSQGTSNLWDQIDDFKWLQTATASPNYTLLGADTDAMSSLRAKLAGDHILKGDATILQSFKIF